MSRRRVLGLLATGIGLTAGFGLLGRIPASADTKWRQAGALQSQLIAAAERQVGVTKLYDPAYVQLAFPGGDVPRDRGVCTDVVIRALRDAFGADLQQLVNADMKRSFAAYPKRWGLSRPDRNIDHRRVPNLETYLTRLGAAVKIGQDGADFAPGDIVSSLFPDGQTHIMIVTNRANPAGARPLIVHNVGAGARIEDRLFDWKITGQFRLTEALITAMGGQSAPEAA